MIAEGQSDLEPEAVWQKEARVYAFSRMRVSWSRRNLSSSKPNPPYLNSARCLSGCAPGGSGAQWEKPSPCVEGDCPSRQMAVSSPDALAVCFSPERNDAVGRSACAPLMRLVQAKAPAPPCFVELGKWGKGEEVPQCRVIPRPGWIC